MTRRCRAAALVPGAGLVWVGARARGRQMTIESRGQAACPDRPQPAELARAAAEAGGRPGTLLVLALPPELLAVHRLVLPGVPAHRAAAAAALALEERLESVPGSLVAGPLARGGSDLAAASLPAETAALLARRPGPVRLVPESLAAAVGCHYPGPVPDGWTELWRPRSVELALFEAGRPLLLRSLPFGPADLTGGRARAAREALAVTLRSAPDRPRHVFLEPGTGWPAAAGPEPGAAPAGALPAGAAAIGLGRAGPVQALAPAAGAGGRRRPARLAAALAALVLALAAADLGVRLHRAGARVAALEAELAHPRPALPGGAPRSRAVLVLGALSAAVPAELDVRLDRLDLEPGRVRLEGEAGSYAALDALRVLAGHLPGHGRAELAESAAGPSGRVRFVLQLPAAGRSP